MSPERPEDGFDEPTLQLAGGFLNARGERRDPTVEESLAWRRYHAACDGLIRRTLLSRGLEPSDLEDCAQEVWIHLIAAGMSGLTPGSAPGRIAAIARNKAIDVFRRRSRRPTEAIEADPARAEADEGDPAGEAELRVWRALGALDRRIPRRNLMSFYLRWIKGMSNPEIGELLGMKPEQVRLHQHRVKQVFLELIAAPPPSAPKIRTESETSGVPPR